ncbi:porphobilinogen synthase [Miltoncostaea marina]|uniref:porphobilinogen synthase n=1 Tax=Miltoncostaea marina TaxID=2843215 RepID=UPI001C3E1069|nr:porphobilinogen synthase [Miltoncostaea marina]
MEGTRIEARAAFPQLRMRRLRAGATMRRMVRETRLSADQLVLPLFAIEGRGARVPIDALPGQARMSPDLIAATARRAYAAGVPAILLFGVTYRKDAAGSAAYEADGVVQTAVAAVKDAVPEMVVMTDVCLCGYTDHGHCGVLVDGEVHNDASLELLARTAVSHAEAGADVVAPSDMMDGRVGAIRAALDAEGHEGAAILAYSAKYASAFYGPFREAAGSAPGHGDRRGYQMDPANGREALRETLLDVAEGADMVMVKPAAAYLDVIAGVRAATDLPVVAYHVSGEYSMLKAAAERGWLDERLAATEVLTGIARAGADLLITYYAEDAARWLREEVA